LNKSQTSEITLQEAQNKVDQWIKQYGVRYFSELTNLAQLTEEVGELARIISRVYGEQSFKKSELKTTDQIKANLREEISDILFVLICLANQTETNLTKAFQENLQKKSLRDKERHLNNPKLSKTRKFISESQDC